MKQIAEILPLRRTFFYSHVAIALALYAVLGGCSDPDPCGISGTWYMSYTFGPGDCLAPGTVVTDTYTMTLIGDKFSIQTEDFHEPDVGVLDYEHCTMILHSSEVIPETPTSYEVRLRSTETLSFRDSTVDSVVSLRGEAYDLGVQIGTCTQRINGVGVKR